MARVLDVQDLRTYLHTRKGLVKAVDGVSFHVDEGEIIGIAGESGCGKSEAMLSVIQLMPKPGVTVSGRVIFNGEDILLHAANSPAMRSIRGSKISFISREPAKALNPTLGIGRQLTEAMELHLNMDKPAAGERAVELLTMAGIPDAGARIDDRPYQFSDGMRRRVMIALALAGNPDIVIADEPTTVPDITAQAQLLDLLRDLAARCNTALIIATRNLGVIARYARRIYVMYAGRIVEYGPCEAVFNSPRHPYTLGLLRSIPRLGENRVSRKLDPTYGPPPDLTDTPPHCDFLPGCTHKTERCEQNPRPEMRPVGEGHYISCYADLRETP